MTYHSTYHPGLRIRYEVVWGGSLKDTREPGSWPHTPPDADRVAE